MALLICWAQWDAVAARRDVAEKAAQAHCSKTDKQGCESLKADVRAANAAEDAIDLGAWQMAFNILGLAGLGATVIYARRAWLAAEGSEVAARDALRHTEDATARQLRPYVFFAPDEKTAPTPLTRDGRATFLIKNFGQTPARKIKMWRGSYSATRPIGDHEVELSAEPIEVIANLAPGADQLFIISMSELTDEQYEAFTDPDLPLVLLIRTRIEYEWAPGKSDGDDMTFVLCSEGAKIGNLPKLGNHQREMTKGG